MYVRIVDWCTCPLACQFVVSVVDRWIMRVGACGESVYVRANWTKTPAVKTTRCTILYCPCSIFLAGLNRVSCHVSYYSSASYIANNYSEVFTHKKPLESS